MAHFWSPAAPGSSVRIWPKSWSGAASASASPTVSITGKRSQPGPRPGRRVPRGRPRRPGVRAARGRRARLRAAPGGDSVGAALGRRSAHLAPRQRRRDAERAGRRARRRRQAPGLRRLLVGLRQHADAAQARGHADRSAVALRAAEARRRAVSASMFTRLYGLETVTMRYFNVFGPRQDPASPYSGVISLFVTALLDGRAADDLRRRRADARLHLRRQRRRRRAAGVRGAGRQRRGDQRRDRRPHLAQRAVRRR